MGFYLPAIIYVGEKAGSSCVNVSYTHALYIISKYFAALMCVCVLFGI